MSKIPKTELPANRQVPATDKNGFPKSAQPAEASTLTGSASCRNQNNLVSVVMPAYNAEKTIRSSIDSVLRQTYRNYELIIVNDGSRDSTKAIIQEYLKKDARIVFLDNEKNSGVSYSRNRAVEAARGKWIAFLDSDDLWREDKLEKQVKLMLDQNAVLSYTASAFIDSEGNFYDYILEAESQTDYRTLLRKNLVSCSSAMITADVVKGIKMPCDHYTGEDYYLFLTVLKKVPYAYGINEPLLIYRMSNHSKSSSRIKSGIMVYNAYRAVGYIAPVAILLCIRYMFYSISKRFKIKHYRKMK